MSKWNITIEQTGYQFEVSSYQELADLIGCTTGNIGNGIKRNGNWFTFNNVKYILHPSISEAEKITKMLKSKQNG